MVMTSGMTQKTVGAATATKGLVPWGQRFLEWSTGPYRGCFSERNSWEVLQHKIWGTKAETSVTPPAAAGTSDKVASTRRLKATLVSCPESCQPIGGV